MNVETAINWIDRLVKIETGKHLSDLQVFTIEQVWQGQKYIDIAAEYHCTEGHVKDIAAALWQLLSQLLGERVTKTNLKSILQRHVAVPIAPSNPSTDASVNYQFIGRERATAGLDELILQGQRSIVIQGEGGVGKTMLAQQYLKTCGCDAILELSMAKETAQITPAEIVIEEWLGQDLQIDPGREFGVALLRLKRQLSTRKIGVLIDNLEPALDRDGRFVSAHRNYVELLRVLTDRQLAGITLITSRDRLCEIDLNLTHHRLSGLDLDTWQTYFNHRQIETNPIAIAPLHQAYGGNAKAMDIIAGNIYTDFDRDLHTYLASTNRTVEAGLRQLITAQFDRLQSLDPDAYRLLCRAGCYRYQDLSRVPIEALLSLLWDVEPECRSAVVNSLKNRSLIEFQSGMYWLHPAIRELAISRLRQTDDWTKTHQQAANYWTDAVVKITDTQTAIAALEAYYHYLEISDFAQAAHVLLEPRDNQWGQFLPLASNLYRMGSIQPVLTAIIQLMPNLPPDLRTAELANILGDLYSIVGKVHRAIATQQQAIDYTTVALANIDRLDRSHQTHCLQILNLDSLLSMGLYQLDLWELNTASELFATVIERANNTIRDRWALKASVCLALAQSYLGNREQSRALLLEIEALNRQHQWTGSSAYFLQKIGQTYTNLGNFDRANTIYQQTLTFCQTGNYLQTQGRTLTGLAQLNRLQGQLHRAQTNHLQSIEILDRLGAKCDLADAYHQAGWTWHQVGNLIQSQTYLERARELFTEINAPQQLAKIADRIYE
jgi:tetratricopeptide (TPR) repeat protein